MLCHNPFLRINGIQETAYKNKAERLFHNLYFMFHT